MWTKLLKGAAQQAAQKGALPAPTQEFLAKIWPTLVGEVIARRSRPLSLQEQTLHLEVDQENLVRELSLHPLPLLRRVRQYSPWTIERLQVSYNPALIASDGERGRPSRPGTSAIRSTEPPTGDVKGPSAPGVDGELQRIIDSIAKHRRERGEDQ